MHITSASLHTKNQLVATDAKLFIEFHTSLTYFDDFFFQITGELIKLQMLKEEAGELSANDEKRFRML